MAAFNEYYTLSSHPVVGWILMELHRSTKVGQHRTHRWIQALQQPSCKL